MRKLIILIAFIAFIVLFASCEKEEELPKLNLVGKTYVALRTTTPFIEERQYTCYDFISSTYAVRYFVGVLGGEYTYYGREEGDSCTYEFSYPVLKIRIPPQQNEQGEEIAFKCYFEDTTTFIESRDWMGGESPRENFVLKYKLYHNFDSYYDF